MKIFNIFSISTFILSTFIRRLFVQISSVIYFFMQSHSMEPVEIKGHLLEIESCFKKNNSKGFSFCIDREKDIYCAIKRFIPTSTKSTTTLFCALQKKTLSQNEMKILSFDPFGNYFFFQLDLDQESSKKTPLTFSQKQPEGGKKVFGFHKNFDISKVETHISEINRYDYKSGNLFFKVAETTPTLTLGSPIFDDENEILGILGKNQKVIPISVILSDYNRFVLEDRRMSKPSLGVFFETTSLRELKKIYRHFPDPKTLNDELKDSNQNVFFPRLIPYPKTPSCFEDGDILLLIDDNPCSCNISPLLENKDKVYVTVFRNPEILKINTTVLTLKERMRETLLLNPYNFFTCDMSMALKTENILEKPRTNLNTTTGTMHILSLHGCSTVIFEDFLKVFYDVICEKKLSHVQTAYKMNVLNDTSENKVFKLNFNIENQINMNRFNYETKKFDTFSLNDFMKNN